MESKLSKVRALLAAGDEVAALRIVARFPHLGAEKEIITRGWDAHPNSDFYRSLDFDPAEVVRTALATIREKYGI